MTLASIISQINSKTGYLIPTGSSTYYISSSQTLSSGSVNSIINEINSLTGYGIPATNVTYVSGSPVANEATIIYVPTAASGTIPTTGIYPGGIIKAEQILNIINALNGVSAYDIIISGSLNVSGSTTLRTLLDLPFVPNEDLLVSNSGSVAGTNIVDGGSF